VAETLIVADLHLSDRNLAVLGLLDVLLARAQGAVALYILGDLFDYWVGDDQPVPGPIAARLEKLAGLPCPVYFQHGNRDFLLGEAMAARCGMKLLPEYYRPQEWAPAVLLCHGDSLCTDDLAYQMMRKQLRIRPFRLIFLPSHCLCVKLLPKTCVRVPGRKPVVRRKTLWMSMRKRWNQ